MSKSQFPSFVPLSFFILRQANCSFPSFMTERVLVWIKAWNTTSVINLFLKPEHTDTHTILVLNEDLNTNHMSSAVLHLNRWKPGNPHVSVHILDTVGLYLLFCYLFSVSHRHHVLRIRLKCIQNLKKEPKGRGLKDPVRSHFIKETDSSIKMHFLFSL